MIPTIKSKNLLLREIRETDKKERCKYGNDPYVMQMFGYDNKNNEMSDLEVEEWFSYMQSTDYGWIVEKDSQIIGQARLNRLDEIDKNAAYSIGFFSTEFCGKGLGVEITNLVLKFGFEQLKLHKVYLRVLEYNKNAVKCYQKCGFKIDGVLRENTFINGRWENDILMSILKDEYRNNYAKK
jgi:[ribosomal protein S5]-alanine N-acetyltransferase